MGYACVLSFLTIVWTASIGRGRFVVGGGGGRAAAGLPNRVGDAFSLSPLVHFLARSILSLS